MLVSLFKTRESRIPDAVLDISWEQFIKELVPANPNEYSDKKTLPAFSAAEYPPGVARSKHTAVRAHFLGFDFDTLRTDSAVASVLERVSRYKAFVYTTWSNFSDPYKLRVLFDVTRPIERDDWSAVWSRVAAIFPECDKSCKDISRLLYPPFCPAPHTPLTFATQGEPINPDFLLTLPVAPPTETTISTDVLFELGKRICRQQKDVGNAIIAVANGETFAQKGERDEMLFRMAGHIAQEWPTVPPARLAQLFSRSVGAVSQRDHDSEVSLELVADKIRRAQENIAVEVSQQEHEFRVARTDRLAELGRISPYSSAELEQICKEQSCTHDQLRRRWIVQRDRSFYLLRLRGYVGPYSATEVRNAILRELSPASSAGVHIYKQSKGKQTRLNTDELMERHGTVALKLKADLLADIATYDGENLTEAPCPLKPVAAVFHPKIQEWLEALGGLRKDKLISWIAALTYLKDPCSALLLTGSKGQGKSLLAAGLARNWHIQPTDMETAMQQFNAAIMSCPLILADEVLPKNFRGASRTGELRKIIQDRQRIVHRKFLSDVDCTGALRFIIAANNHDILSFSESLNEDDVSAISDRFLHIPIGRAGHLIDDPLMWAERGIAEHSRWLKANHKWVPEGRFLVMGDDNGLAKMISAMSGAKSEVARWLVSYVLNPERMSAIRDRWVGRYQGEFVCSAQTIEHYWSVYLNSKMPEYKALSRALSDMSIRPITAPFTSSGVRCRVINLDAIYTWLEATEFATRKEFDGSYEFIPMVGKQRDSADVARVPREEVCDA